MKIENSILGDILLEENFKEITKSRKYPDKRYFQKVGVCIIIDGPNIMFSDNIYDYYFSESNLLEELTSIIYYTQLIKRDRDTLTDKLKLKFNELNKIYFYLKSETENYPRYTQLSEHYIKITKLKNNIEKAIDQLQ